ncbi:hypothetical protein BGW42_008140 [Actinomortierella wolfii]|nr:hypothetical protein BGW42_008140 [Actinomortierella wolfii]
MVAAVNIPPKVKAAAKRYQELRKIKGHFEGGEWNDAVDSPQGEKYKVMKILQEYFGKPGTSVRVLKGNMGEPDVACTEVGDKLALGQAKCRRDGQSVYLIYKWRSFHDYVWFKQNMTSKSVVESDWYMALE